MPMTVTVLRSWDMACSLSGCLWPAYRWLGREHGRTIPLPELPERREPLFQFRISLRQGDHDANPARLLRALRERPSGCSAVEQRDERASFHSHLVGLLSSRERIAHLGGAGDPALRKPRLCLLGVRCGGRGAAREFSGSPLTADMWTNAGFRRYGPQNRTRTVLAQHGGTRF